MNQKSSQAVDFGEPRKEHVCCLGVPLIVGSLLQGVVLSWHGTSLADQATRTK